MFDNTCDNVEVVQPYDDVPDETMTYDWGDVEHKCPKCTVSDPSKCALLNTDIYSAGTGCKWPRKLCVTCFTDTTTELEYVAPVSDGDPATSTPEELVGTL